ncbi:MAG: RNA polymerase sigma factor [Puniceicoccales bacterium]
MIQSAFSYGIDFGVSLLSGIRDPLTRTMPDAVDTSSPTGHLTPLVVEAQQGSERAFRELVRIHKNQVLRLAARFAANTAELDELAQDIFIDLHRSLKRFRGKAPLEHWLSRIASRRCRDHLRRRYRRDRFRSLDSMQESGFDPWVSEKIDERVELMMDAMRQLKPDDQTVLILFSLEGYSIKDIADHFSWTDSKVKVRLFRARKELKARMNHETH